MSRIETKFLQDNAVNDVKLRLRNNMALRGRNAGNTADVEILKVTTGDIIEILQEMAMGTRKITGMGDPAQPQDAATKAYVDSVVSGLSDPKDAARAATTADLPASTYDNGTGGVGATLTADANGALPAQDGISLAVDDRLLVKNQGGGASSLENGIYKVTQLGDVSNPWILTRTTDADQDAEVTQGMFVPVSQGTVNGALGFMVTTPDPITVGTTAIQFVQFGQTFTEGNGININGSVISVDDGAGLGFSGAALVVQVDDDTTAIKSDQVVGRKTFEESFTLNSTDISNGYVDLTKIASQDSEVVFPRFGIKQKKNVDWTASYTGGAGGKTRITFAGDLATIVAVGDVLDIRFESLDYT